MTARIIGGSACLRGTYKVPGDKSVSHRSVMLGAIADGLTEIDGFLTGEDCLSTIGCFRQLGIDISLEGTNLTVRGGRFTPPTKTLDVGNSGTTLRLMTGLLAGQAFATDITGDASIQKRPMKRVCDPLALMGARISGDRAPITITGSPLKGIEYRLPVASAQVKSAILLASLYAEGETHVEEPVPTRDHTEIMLRYLGADLERRGATIVSRKSSLVARPISVPGDISSAAFLMVAAAILPGSDICLQAVGINPTRMGIIHVLKRMGADIKLKNERVRCGEAIADIEICRHSQLHGTIVEGAEIPSLIDEIPALAVAALFAKGETIIRDAAELRVKETDRIQAVVEEFGNFFPNKNPITAHEDGMTIKNSVIQAAKADSRGDHRLAMSLSILALAAQGESFIHNADCADISFPGFFKLLPNAICENSP